MNGAGLLIEPDEIGECAADIDADQVAPGQLAPGHLAPGQLASGQLLLMGLVARRHQPSFPRIVGMRMSAEY